MIKFKRLSDSFRFQGVMKYLIVYDHAAGKKNRFEVLIENADDPVVIGRELDLKYCRELIANYERVVKLLQVRSNCPYIGDRLQAMAVVDYIINERYPRGKGKPVKYIYSQFKLDL